MCKTEGIQNISQAESFLRVRDIYKDQSFRMFKSCQFRDSTYTRKIVQKSKTFEICKQPLLF